jgi:hypothetical protein
VAEVGVCRIQDRPSHTSVGPKFLQWVELRDRKTNAVFLVANHQVVPAIERAGRPNGSERRLGLYRLQMKGMLAKVDELAKSGPVFVTGDFNIAAQADARVRSAAFPYSQGAGHRLSSNWRTLGYPDGGTSAGGRHTDYVSASTGQAAPPGSGSLAATAPTTTLSWSPSATPALSRLQADQQRNLQLVQQTTRQPVVAGSYGAIRRRQTANAPLVEQGVRAAGGSGRAVYVALVVAVGESDLINLSYGDQAGPDSRGLFQQRTSWGTVVQRMDPAWAAGAFMLGPHQRRSGGLLQLPGWEQLPVTTAIHRVQVNADPNHYRRLEARAREIGQQAGVDFDAPAGAGAGTTGADSTSCTGTQAAADTSLTGIETGACPLDRQPVRHESPGLWRLEPEDGGSDVADGVVQGGDGAGQSGAEGGVAGHGGGALDGEAGVEQLLEDLVLEVAGDPASVLELAQPGAVGAGVGQPQGQRRLVGEAFGHSHFCPGEGLAVRPADHDATSRLARTSEWEGHQVGDG